MSTSLPVIVCPKQFICSFCGTAYGVTGQGTGIDPSQLGTTLAFETACNNGSCPQHAVAVQITVPVLNAYIVGS